MSDIPDTSTSVDDGTLPGGIGGDVPPPSPTPEEAPPPEPDPVPDAPPPPDTIAWEPQTWYAITYACHTAGCPNQNQIRSAPRFYSNNGAAIYLRVFDSTCRTYSPILTATKLDPQPIEE